MGEPPKSDKETSNSGRLRDLLDAAVLLNSTLELEELTEIILNIVRDQLRVERVTVFVVDQDRYLLRSLVAQDIQREIVLRIGSGIAGTVAATGQTIDVLDAYTDPRFDTSFDVLLNYRTRDVLALPIVNRKGDVRAVLELLNRAQPISPSDQDYLRGMSVYIALALENAWRYQQVVHQERIEKDLVDLRDRIARVERLSVMEQVLLGVAHEINNPLAVILGNAGLLKLRVSSDPKSLEYVEKIESAVARGSEVTRHYINFIERQSHENQLIDLGEVVRQIVELRAWGWELLDIESTIKIDKAPVVFGNEGQLQLLLMFLLLNAEEATLLGRAPRHIDVHLNHNRAEQRIRIAIKDTGPGISAQTQDEVFRGLFGPAQANARSNIELATVRAIAERHHGRVWYDTVEGQGTTFTFELPVPIDVQTGRVTAS